MNRIAAFFTSLILFFTSFFSILGGTSEAKFYIDTSKTGDIIPNIASVNNVWDMGTMFYYISKNEKYDVFEFVEYIQLMQCTGGTKERDLFKDPLDTSTMTDYDFTRLINNCRGIVNIGAKPWLKLGSVPLKFTTNPDFAGMGMNLYPPDDFNVYYDYIKAIAQALVDEFGLEEVKTWRFGCMTEYENNDWFMAKGGDPVESAVAYCKLYDYTTQALIDVIGDDVFMGAHGMVVTEGLWDEEIFIKHVAQGTNYANGKKGSHIDYLAVSFYDKKPGEYTKGYTLPETVDSVRKSAEKYGLTDLIYGVDEGRLLVGNSAGKTDNQLLARIVGFTWQAAYDARLFKQAIDSGMDYFSSWHYLSGGITEGYPTVSYHVLKNLSGFANSKKINVDSARVNARLRVETDCLAGWNEGTRTLRIMAYNFKNEPDYSNSANMSFEINAPQFDGKTVTITKYVINDDCNYFDEWQQDRIKYNITDDCFSWSPDDPIIESSGTLSDEAARKIYFDELRDKYEQCSQLTPETETVTVENGKIELSQTLGGSNVVFYVIEEK